MRSAWAIVAGAALCIASGASSAAASPLPQVGPGIDRGEASSVQLVWHEPRRFQRFGGRYYILRRGPDGRVRVFVVRPRHAMPRRFERRHGRALANRRALERALRAPGRTVRRDRGRAWEVPKPAEPPVFEPEVAARPEPEIVLPMPKPEPPVSEFEEFDAAPETSEQALAPEEPDISEQVLAPEQPTDEVHREPAISCEAAAEIVSEFGFSEVEATSCSDALYAFAAKRDGASYSIKIDPADGELAEVQKE